MNPIMEQSDKLFQKIEELEFLTIASFQMMQKGKREEAEIGIHLIMELLSQLKSSLENIDFSMPDTKNN